MVEMFSLHFYRSNPLIPSRILNLVRIPDGKPKSRFFYPIKPPRANEMFCYGSITQTFAAKNNIPWPMEGKHFSSRGTRERRKKIVSHNLLIYDVLLNGLLNVRIRYLKPPRCY